MEFLCYGTQQLGFQGRVILDLWGMVFHAMVAFGLELDFLFKSIWACCEIGIGSIQVLVPMDIKSRSFDILVNYVRCHGPNFDETIVLNENCVTSEISMENRGITCSVKIAAKR